MKTEVIKISEVKPNPNNPRVIKDDKFEKLVASIKEFPKMLQIRPIVVNDDMIVLGGNMRLKACKAAVLKEVHVIKASELNEDEQRQFIIKDNVSGGEWDWDMLANEWDSEQLEEWGLDVPNFGETELEAVEDDFDATPPEEPITLLGDLYEIGEHRLLCGDSTQTDTFEKLMQGELADMVLTDPPYNVAYEGGTKDKLKIKNDDMSNDDFYKFLYDFYTALSTVVKKGGVIYVWHASSEVINFAKAFIDAGFLLKQQLIWLKSQLVMGRQDYQWKHEPCLEGVNAESWEIVKEHEPCLYGWKEGAGHFWKGGRKQTTILEFDKPLRSGEHPTMKPIPLFGLQIGNSTKINDIVIDAFGGSGTTMVACEQLKRKARVIEYDPKYCDVIVKRMIKHEPSIKVKRNGQIIDNKIWHTTE
jgi:DNA modification methylase